MELVFSIYPIRHHLTAPSRGQRDNYRVKQRLPVRRATYRPCATSRDNSFCARNTPCRWLPIKGVYGSTQVVNT